MTKKLMKLVLALLLAMSLIPTQLANIYTVSADEGSSMTFTVETEALDPVCAIAGTDYYSIEGGEFTVFNSKNVEIAKFYIDADGKGHANSPTGSVTLGNLPNDTYTVKQTKSFNGYENIADQKVTLETVGALPSSTMRINTVSDLYGYANTSGPGQAASVFWKSDTFDNFVCGNPGNPAPAAIATDKGTGWHTLNGANYTLVTNQLIRKVMYYGYHGPKQWSGFANLTKNVWSGSIYDANTYANPGVSSADVNAYYLTHHALGQATGRQSGNFSGRDTYGYAGFWSYVNSAANAPDSFKVYKISYSGNVQDMYASIDVPQVPQHKDLVVKTKAAFDPISVVLTKRNKIDEKIAGAQFTMKYYNQDVASVEDAATLTPTATWVFETDSDGWMLYDPTYKISGDELFYSTAQDAYILLPGTYTVEETLVPTNYVKADTFMIKVSNDPNVEPVYYNETGTRSIPQDATEGYMLEELYEGHLRLRKTTADATWNAEHPLAGTVYELYEDQECTKRAKAIDSTDVTFTIGADDLSNSVKLIPGDYWLKETVAAKGYELATSPIKVTVTDGKVLEQQQLDVQTFETSDEPAYPTLKTKALDKEDGDNIILNAPNQTVVDTITFTNLEPNVQHTGKITARNQATGEELLDAQGNVISKEFTFTPNDKNGETTVEITFDGSLFPNSKINFKEEIFLNGKSVITEDDLSNTDQTVTVLDMQTTASIVAIGEKTDNTFEITDIVEYKGLTPNKEYTLEGKLMGVDENGNETPLLDAQGQPIVITKTLTPTAADGQTTMTFVIEGYKVENKKCVVFETLYDGSNKVAIHADINDNNQTVEIPGLNFWVSVVKRDAMDHTKLLKNCEITIFNQDGTIAKDVNGNDAVGITDGEGNIVFEMFWAENGYYAVETKAPLGYRINSNKHQVELHDTYDYAQDNPIVIYVNDEAAPAVKTGDNSQLLMYLSLLAMANIGFIAVVVFEKKRLNYN